MDTIHGNRELTGSISRRKPGVCAMCGDVAQHRRPKGSEYCSKHFRFMQMRWHAKRYGKTVPSFEELESLVPIDMRCRHCNQSMNWLQTDGKRTQITLQHDRNGTHRLICFSCNARHAFMPGDLFYALKAGERYCPRCKTVKLESDFNRDNKPQRTVKLATICKVCSKAHCAQWRAKRKQAKAIKVMS